jgi:hypothetical protein
MNPGKDFQARFPNFNFPADLLFNLIEKELFECVRIVQERKSEDTDRQKQDRHNTEHQCPETNGQASLSTAALRT